MSATMQIGEIVLGHYEINDIISEGGQGLIAKAIDQKTGDTVVIKMLTATPEQSGYAEALGRFQRAAKLRLHHPNIVDPIDSGEENGQWYIVMPYVDGLTLENYVMAQGGRLEVKTAVTLIIQIAEGLEAIHQNGLVHRDIKPSNIMIPANGSAQILDMGICRNTCEKTLAETKGLFGSLPWMAFEQVNEPGTEDYRTDLYSLGAVFYHMLTGHLTVQGNDIHSIAMSICQYTPPSPRQIDPTIPLHIDQACMRLLEKQREARFQNARDFIQAVHGPTPAVAAAACISCGHALIGPGRYCSDCGAPQYKIDPTPRCLACGSAVGQESVCPGCHRRFGATDHQLHFTAGSALGSIFRCPEGSYVVGRDILSPQDVHISRKHILVNCTNGTITIQDAGSTNRTFVNGQPASRLVPLSPRQTLCIAGNIATYQRH